MEYDFEEITACKYFWPDGWIMYADRETIYPLRIMFIKGWKTKIDPKMLNQ